MRTKYLLGMIAVLGLALLPGCVSSIDGRKQAGISFTKSIVENSYDVKPQVLYQAAKEVLKKFGTITSDDVVRSLLEAKVDTRTVWITVEEVDNRVSKLIVQARSKGGGGDTELATYIDKQIAMYLVSGSAAPPASPKR